MKTTGNSRSSTDGSKLRSVTLVMSRSGVKPTLAATALLLFAAAAGAQVNSQIQWEDQNVVVGTVAEDST
jgi:hypothetical protein